MAIDFSWSERIFDLELDQRENYKRAHISIVYIRKWIFETAKRSCSNRYYIFGNVSPILSVYTGERRGFINDRFY